MNLLNIFLHIIHLVIIIFCLTGWLYQPLLPWHLLLCGLILISWFGIGFMIKQPGYCVVTGFQQHIQRKINPEQVMTNYVHYLYSKLTGFNSSPKKLDILTQACLYYFTGVSIYMNLRNL